MNSLIADASRSCSLASTMSFQAANIEPAFRSLAGDLRRVFTFVFTIQLLTIVYYYFYVRRPRDVSGWPPSTRAWTAVEQPELTIGQA